MTTPKRLISRPNTEKATAVYNTSLGEGYNVKVTMVLHKDSPRRTPSIIALCDRIAKKQRQLLYSSLKQSQSLRYVYYCMTVCIFLYPFIFLYCLDSRSLCISLYLQNAFPFLQLHD